jgi:glycosyltransferase involved in cell wall biosynthesis
LSLINDENELNHIPELKKVFVEIYLVIERSENRSMFFPTSFLGSYSRVMIKRLKEIIKKFSIDAIHIESNELLYLVEFIKAIPVIYTEHDISAVSFFRSYYRPMGSFVSRAFDYLKRLNFHKNLYKKVNKILTVSETDKIFLDNFVLNKKVFYLPTGVDLDYFYFHKERYESTKLVFIGWYLHYPNEDAVIYFSKKIFPNLKKKLPAIEFLVVGLDPTERVKRLMMKGGIRVTGPVQDVREYLKSSGVFVSPIRLGAGIKSKVLEAMAMGTPVVSTTRGFYGIGALNNKEILISDSPREFVQHVIRLLSDSNLRLKLAKNARRLVEKRYNWQVIADDLDKIYRDTISKVPDSVYDTVMRQSILEKVRY